VQFGRFVLEQLSEGNFLASREKILDRYRPVFSDGIDTVSALGAGTAKLVGIDPLYIDTGNEKVLIDAGIGYALDRKNPDPGISNLITSLEVLDIDPASINTVIVSHLHADHVKGLSYTDTANNTKPVLPNARIVVQRREWEFAMEQTAQPGSPFGAEYELDDIYRLVADGRFEFIDTDYKIITPGIEIIRTGGHTPGHQIVRLSESGFAAYFTGDIIESAENLNRYLTASFDEDPIVAKTQRSFWLKRLFDEQALAIFYHGTLHKGGFIQRNITRLFRLEPVTI
jgi:glyoxylase-like metal-dependent hydrolase (beta-lactamase superfamily II)